MPKTQNIIEVSEATFESDVINRSHEVPVVVDFWAPWCGPCHMLGPVLEKLAHESGGSFVLAKVNVDENPNLSMRYQVMSIPAVKAFKGGAVASQFVGAQPEARVRQFIKELAPSAADIALAQASSLLATRHWAEAEDAFREALDFQPNLAEANLGLVKSLLAQGKGCEARELLGDLASAIAEKYQPLANLLCDVESGVVLPANDLEAEYFQAARLISRGNLAAAMDGLLDVLRQHKKFRGGEPRLVMLALFELLGDSDPLTREYRSELASVLF